MRGRTVGSARSRGLPQAQVLRLRQAAWSLIGHMKTVGLSNHTRLRGTVDTPMHMLSCGAGHNLHMILAHLRVLCCVLVERVAQAIIMMVASAASMPQGRLRI